MNLLDNPVILLAFVIVPYFVRYHTHEARPLGAIPRLYRVVLTSVSLYPAFYLPFILIYSFAISQHVDYLAVI